MTDVREDIRDHVDANPGVHFNALVRELDLAAGQVQHHVRRLRDEDALDADGFYGRTHYFPPETDEWERGALALARRETARDVLVSLLENGPSSPGDVAESVGVARSTLEHHVSNLEDCGVVEKRRDSRNRVTLALTRPDETVAVLEAVRPSAPERFVDRFERLVDSLLD
ncbi:winged helix-turn-helix transcriptional regulator [Halobacterium litoreum]|uniref:Winged helix-turn-helix transcriptional regulator n=1 Tax=Halobacterium litoreum TaxID=2039234 RepID=A0ABD5NI70_9EURY|nr:winged helix-turn-helix transcriptional regulator [Halobacterium litoreum]UHH12154.1 winged helix-turn-helix transcriptional regulator [Halobacterium litoreum]